MNKKTRRSQMPRAFRPRLLAASTALLAGLPAFASALGLGEIQYKSWLGEPLKAQIDLVNLPADVDRGNLKFRQVDRAEAERLGVEIISNWHRFNFEVDTSKQNFQVQLQSQQPIKEPYLNILVELSWPQGTLYREYTVLLDPAPAVPASSETQTAERSAPVRAETPRAPLPVASQRVMQEQLDLQAGQEQYRVASGDTLYGIAQRLSTAQSHSPNQLATWLYRNNPEAFINGDANRLIAGRNMRLPEDAEFVSATSTPSRSVTTASERQGLLVLDQPVQVEGDNQLALLDRAARGDLQEQLSSTRAVLDYLVKENRDLKDRLTYLESSEYLNTLKELVELQKKEITSLRAQIADASTETLLARPETQTTASAVPTQNETISNETMASSSTSAGNEVETLQASFANSEVPFVATVTSQPKVQHLWTFLSSGFAAALAALFAFFLWRSRSKPLSATPIPPRKEEDNEAELPTFTYSANKKEISLDDYVDLNLALNQQASNDQLMHENAESVEPAKVEVTLSMRDVAEKVQQERNKVEYLQQRIKEKTDEYNERKKQGIEEPKQVEEIEIDPELEQYLKF